MQSMKGQVENADVSDASDISDFFSPTFINPTFPFSPIVQIRKLGSQKIRDFLTSVFSIFAYSQIRKLGFQKSTEIFKHPSFRHLPTVRYENLDFKKKSEIFKCPSFRYLPIVKYENLDFKNPRFSNIRLFNTCL